MSQETTTTIQLPADFSVKAAAVSERKQGAAAFISAPAGMVKDGEPTKRIRLSDAQYAAFSAALLANPDAESITLPVGAKGRKPSGIGRAAFVASLAPVEPAQGKKASK